MASNTIGNVAVVTPYGGSGNAIHALDSYPPDGQHHATDTWRTLCGRNAASWSRLGDKNIVAFSDSAYACKACAAKIFD